MPRGDGTGPQGRGPLTGRGLGYCNPQNSGSGPARVEPGQDRVETWPKPRLGRGLGLGTTRGLGRRPRRGR